MVIFLNDREMNCKKPQGLSHILYPVFTNDLLYVMEKSSVILHVDESTMFYSAKE